MANPGQSRRNSDMHPALSVHGPLLLNLFEGIGANMRRKLFVALQCAVFYHRIERAAGGLLRKFEPPATFGATENPQNPAPQSIPACVSRTSRFAALHEPPPAMKARNVQLYHQHLLS